MENQSIGDGNMERPGTPPTIFDSSATQQGENENRQENLDFEEIIPSVAQDHTVEIVLSAVNELSEKLSTVYSNLLITDEVIEEAIKEGDKESLKVELEDVKQYEKDYNEAYVKLRTLAQSSNTSLSDVESANKRFILLAKKSKAKIMKYIEPNSTVKAKPDRLKFERIELPVFDGKKDEWARFKRLFQTYIHENSDLDDAEKMQRLTSKLTGEAAILIDGLPIDGAYYKEAWGILLSHYDDPMKRISRHLDALFSITKENNLRKLVTHFRAHVTALKVTFNQNSNLDMLSQFCIHAFLQRASQSTRLDWEREIEKRKEFVSFDEFIRYMDGRCNAYERATHSHGEGNSKEKSSPAPKRVLFGTSSSNPPSTSTQVCHYCRETHLIYRCPKFIQLAPTDRNSFIRKKRLCPRCFRGIHKCNRTCDYKCKVCKRPHNTLLHIENFTPSQGKTPSTSKNIDPNMGSASTTKESTSSDAMNSGECNAIIENNYVGCGWVGSVITDDEYALLATAIIEVSNLTASIALDGRALLDNGSQYNFITKEFAKKLNSPFITVSHCIKFIGNASKTTQRAIDVQIKSQHSNFSMKVRCLVIDEIVDSIPDQYFPIIDWQFPKYISLADPNFNVPSRVDILLGLGVFWRILKPKFRDLGILAPRLFATHLGWIVTGDIKFPTYNKLSRNYNILCGFDSDDIPLSTVIERLWLLDDFNDATNKKWSFEESECEDFFLKTCKRNTDGRYVVRLPFKIDRNQLGSSKTQALKRFYYIERRLNRDENLQKQYVECIQEYFTLNHIKEVDENIEAPHYYIPHHAVIKITSSSTKCRVVFDASASTTSGVSLNDCLMVGPVVQSDMMSILLRARSYAYLFTADISKMYRRILVDNRDTPFQRILWRPSPKEPIKSYELTTVTFGEASSPYLATRCLKKLAEDEGDNFPAAKNVLLRDFYVDDVCTGSNSVKKAIEIRKQLTQMLASAGFPLTKWCSNNEQVLEGVPQESREKTFALYTGDEFVIKTLGVFWFPSEDVFKFLVQDEQLRLTHFTKRNILSAIGKIFDPYGFLGPITMTAKFIMQDIWSHGRVSINEQQQGQENDKKSLSWDDPVPENIKNFWIAFSSQLSSLNHFSIPRHLFRLHDDIKRIELHGYCDASEKGYGAVIYVRSIYKNEVLIRLLCSKGRVAPLKKVTLPRLELCGAVVLAELVNKVKIALASTIKIDQIRLWSDSEITLCWLASPPHRWEVFVGNRVKRIQTLSEQGIWDYISSKENPADILSRGLNPNLMIETNVSTWLEGPRHLHNQRPFYNQVAFKCSNKNTLGLNRSRKIVACVSNVRSTIFERFSEYTKLIRITAWLMRFSWNSHWYGPHITGSLNLFELDWALNCLIKLVQCEHFSGELKVLQRHSQVDSKSTLLCLSPFLDAQGIIRVGGRLQQSDLSWEQRFPIILPSKHKFTKLLIRYEHLRHFHAGPLLLRSVLRRKFWIMQQNIAIQSCIHKCHTCIKVKSNIRSQMMGVLPRARIVPSRAFQVSGVDYFGPVKLRERKIGRGPLVIIQAFVAIFVCFATKAIHLELVSNLTSDDFIAALDRFISRRGIPVELHSDQGPTFIGAKSIIKQLKEFFDENGDVISRHLLNKGCNFKFNPAQTPHFGGLWEAGVKAVKNPLKAETGNALFTYEQYSTFLAQIEAILNSRPLILESTDPNEPSVLTPGHFLIGGPTTALPNPDITQVPASRLKYWELVKQKSQKFWKKWSCAYLNTLQQRSKWRLQKKGFKKGDVVLVKEDDSPPAHWPLGTISDIHPGPDGLVRVVTVRMRVGTYEGLKNSKSNIIPMKECKRHIGRIIYLPCDNESETTQPH